MNELQVFKKVMLLYPELVTFMVEMEPFLTEESPVRALTDALWALSLNGSNYSVSYNKSKGWNVELLETLERALKKSSAERLYTAVKCICHAELIRIHSGGNDPKWQYQLDEKL